MDAIGSRPGPVVNAFSGRRCGYRSGVRVDGATELVPERAEGRVHVVERRAEVGDCGEDALVRLDGLARILQDVAGEDAADAGVGGGWVVRRTLIEVAWAPALREPLEVRTFCGGLGGRWAERRSTVVGARGAAVQAASVWVHVDPDTGRPSRLPGAFVDRFGPAAGGREVRARLLLPTDVPPDARRLGWTVRVADLDVLGHVNNAVGWAALEEVLAAARRRGGSHRRLRAEVEHRRPVLHGQRVGIAWWLDGDAVVGVVADADALDAATGSPPGAGAPVPAEAVATALRAAPLDAPVRPSGR